MPMKPLKVGLTVVPVKGSCKWAMRARVRLPYGSVKTRYRGYHYKRDAIADLATWAEMAPYWFYPREFNHNFHSAEELGIHLKGE